MNRTPRAAALLLPALLFASVSTIAQTPAGPRPWQTLQMPTAEQVKAAWVTPPPEYGPEPYYGLNGPVTLDTVRHDLDTMHALGFQAVTVQYGRGASFSYLSPEYLDFFKQFVAEAKKRNMRIWIVDDAGYPSGFAGGKISSEHPELRMQALVAVCSPAAPRPAVDSPAQGTVRPFGCTPLAGGSHYDQPVPPETVAVTALGAGGAMQQIPIAAGRAQWTTPADGNWTVYTVQHAFRTSPTRSDTNPNNVKDGSQSLEDYLNPDATAQYLAFTHEAYKKAVGDEFGKTILGFRGDEPDYSISGLPWTPKFFDRFQAKKGYDIRPYLAAFLQGPRATLTPQQLLARADYYDVFADMFRDGFFKPQGDWCAANGLEYQVHLNHEEMQIQLAHSEGDFFRDMRFVEVPGIDSIWHQIWTDTVSDFPRFASSAAHVYGHPRAFTESFAAYRPEPDITMARYVLNEQFVRGVNLVETMYFPATSTPGRYPSPYMRDPGFPALTDYTRRMSYMMSMGRPAAEVALLLPAESLWMGDANADNTFVSTERVLSEHQIDFDIVDEDAIGNALPLQAGGFASMSGNVYRTVLVPAADLLPQAVVARLRDFAARGGHVVFLGAKPTRIGTRTDLDARPATDADFAWGTLVPGSLPVVPTPPAQPPAAPPEPMAVPAELLSALKAAGPVSALQLDQPSTAIRFLHRQWGDAVVFLVFNESADPVTRNVTLRGGRHSVELWDPQTGKSAPAPGAKFDAGQATLPLTLPAYGTAVLVVR